MLSIGQTGGLNIVYYNDGADRLTGVKDLAQNFLIPIDTTTQQGREYAKPLWNALTRRLCENPQ